MLDGHELQDQNHGGQDHPDRRAQSDLIEEGMKKHVIYIGTRLVLKNNDLLV